MVALPFRIEASLPEPGSPIAWALHDGKPGMASQSLGLAEATGLPFVEKSLTIRLPWARLPPQLWWAPLHAPRDAENLLAPPWPDLVIGCGRSTALPVLAIRRASGGRTLAVQVQDPRVGRREFDLLFVPEHDRVRGPRIVVTRGALHRVTAARLAAERRRFPSLEAMPRPILSVLLGGNNRAYRLTLDRLGEMAAALAQLARTSGGSILATPSRRTGEAGIALLRRSLAGIPAQIWDGTGANPYYAYLALADALFVTADSISMVSEAAATGKPVHILPLDGGDAKFRRFHSTMQQAGITRPFRGRLETWAYAPPDDSAQAGAMLRALVLDRIAARMPQ